jgi:hypothetical protein
MYMRLLKRLPELAVLLALCLCAVTFFAVTNPKNVPPIVLVAGFVLLLGIWYCLLRLAMRLSGAQERLTGGQYNGLLLGLTIVPIMLLALQSIGQLTARDVVTLSVLFAAGYFYVSRMSSAGK